MNEVTESKKSKAIKHKENPFLESAITTVKTRKKRLTVAQGSTIIDNETGEATAETVIAQIVEVDEGQFVKLFTKDLEMFFDLSSAALKTFGLILKAVQTDAINRDRVYLNYSDEEFLQTFKLSKSVFYLGIAELIEKKFIAKSTLTNLYFINPALFFNGDRARFVKEYRVKQGEATLDEQVKARIANKKARKELGNEATVEDVQKRAAEITKSGTK
jgi:hypothetical protein